MLRRERVPAGSRRSMTGAMDCASSKAFRVRAARAFAVSAGVPSRKQPIFFPRALLAAKAALVRAKSYRPRTRQRLIMLCSRKRPVGPSICGRSQSGRPRPPQECETGSFATGLSGRPSLQQGLRDVRHRARASAKRRHVSARFRSQLPQTRRLASNYRRQRSRMS